MIKVVVVTLAILLLTASGQTTCSDNSLSQIATGLITLGAPNATSAQTSYVQTLDGTMGVYAQVFSAFAIAGVQAVSQQKYYSLVVDEVYFQNSNTKMRFTMDYLYNQTGEMFQSQWVSLTLSYIVVSSQFESYTGTAGGNYIWAGSSDLIVDVTGNFGTFNQGSIFDSASSSANIAGNNVCGYLGKLPNNNSPVFDYICDGTAINDQIIPHFYIMGIKFVPGTYELAASAIIDNYYLTAQPTAQFGTTTVTGFGPLVRLNSFGGSLVKVKVGIVLTIVKNLFTGYPNTLQKFQYSQIYTTQTLFNAKAPLGQPNPVVAASSNKYEYAISSIKYRIYGFSSFAISRLPKTSTTIDMKVSIPDIYTLFVNTDNTDFLSGVVISSDMYVLNDGSLCGGSTQPSVDMVNVGQKVYRTIPDLAPQQQNIQQTANTPLTWQLKGFPLTDGSDLITFSVSIDFSNFTVGNSYLISTSLSAINNLWSDVYPDAQPLAGYVKYSIQVQGNTVNQKLINKTSADVQLTLPFVNSYDYNFGINIATANPKIIFTIIVPRPVGANPQFGAQIQLEIKEYSVLFNPLTGCCVTACQQGQGINILTSPATCVECSSAQSLTFDSKSGACQCQTGFYNLLSGTTVVSSGSGISCFPCMGRLCSTCTSAKPAVCSSCVMGAAFDANGTCNCLTGYFEVGGVKCQACSYKCASCSVSGACNTCSSTLRDINSNCSCPNGYYDDGTTTCKVCNSICKTCSSATQCTSCFTQNNRTLSNGQCVCANGFYQRILANNSVVCAKCGSECEQCTGPDTCSNCSSSSNRILGYDSAGHQTCTCLSGYSAIADGSCVQNGCSASAYCSNCNQVNGTSVCIKCIASTNRFLAIPQYACLCSPGFYEANGVCVACSSGCATCTNATTCTSCVVSALPSNNGTCQCPNNFFFATAPIRFCQKCSDYCISCRSLATCDTCFTGFTKVSNGSCICPRGNFVDRNTLRCVACVSGCTTCASSTSCQVCNAPLLSQNGTCVTRCNIGFFAAGQTCTPCASGCTFCQKSDSCQVCNAGLYMYLGACYVNCGVGNATTDGSYGTIAAINDTICIACNAPCEKCVQHPSKCLTCLPGQGNFYQFNCLASCPTGTYAKDGVCQLCSFQCAACLGASDICIACPTGQYLFEGACFSQCPVNLVNGICPNLCPAGFFTAQDGSCNRCSSNCVSCQDSASFCTQCQGSLVASNGTCVQSCPTNSYLNNGNCVLCVSGCNRCSGLPSNCSACVGGFFLSGSICVASCGNASYYDTASASCRSCPSNCRSCSAANFCTSCTNALSNPVNGICYDCIYPCTACSSYQVCSACLTGFSLLNTSCITSCPSGSSPVAGVCTCNNGFFQNGACVSSCSSGFTNIAGSCVKCDSSCAQCSGSSTRCSSCPTGFNLDAVAGTCTVNKNCATGQYFSADNNICTRICPSGLSYQDSMCLSQCLEGFIDNGFGGCVVQPQSGGCSYPYFNDQGVCVSTCSVGTFPNSQNRVCDACGSNCFSCLSKSFCISCTSGFDVNNGICITGSNCASGLYKLNGVCVQSCPIGTFLSNGYCQRICPAATYYYMQGCYDVCPTVANLLTSDACVSSCPSGTTLTNGNCQTNSQSCATGEFFNSQTRACDSCTYPCSNCQFTPSYCTACPAGMTLNSNRCVASTGCSGTTFRNTNGTCSPCPAKCQSCVSATQCSACSSGYQFNGYDCVVALTNLQTLTLAQSSISKRDTTVFISIKLALIPNGLTSSQINSFFIVVPSVNDNVVKVNQWQDATDKTVAWIAIQYNPIPVQSTAFITLNAKILATSLANIGYTAGDNFLAVAISQAIDNTPSTVNIPASATNSAADSAQKVPSASNALKSRLNQNARLAA